MSFTWADKVQITINLIYVKFLQYANYILIMVNMIILFKPHMNPRNRLLLLFPFYGFKKKTDLWIRKPIGHFSHKI